MRYKSNDFWWLSNIMFPCKEFSAKKRFCNFQEGHSLKPGKGRPLPNLMFGFLMIAKIRNRNLNMKYEINDFSLCIRIVEGFSTLIDIELNGPFSSELRNSPKVNLIADYDKSLKRILIEDVQGNGYYSGLQGKGTGTLLANTAIQLFKEKYAHDTKIIGELSTVGDPTDTTLSELCRINRERFWASFGFAVIDGGKTGRKIESSIEKVKIKKTSKMIEGVLPAFIEITKFT